MSSAQQLLMGLCAGLTLSGGVVYFVHVSSAIELRTSSIIQGYKAELQGKLTGLV